MLRTNNNAADPNMGAEKLHDNRGRDLDKDVTEEKDGVDPVKKFASWIPSEDIFGKIL
jgi:hypothetical protein